jgi:hypothetical protein
MARLGCPVRGGHRNYTKFVGMSTHHCQGPEEVGAAIAVSLDCVGFSGRMTPISPKPQGSGQLVTIEIYRTSQEE